ncbi:MAG: hypothetical protein NZM37_01970 [Sandaracinaceae bacterium]|nr:hypothetical protein [Sandaracinaceae bacterium]MDW8247477.1 hypothetical protein [Sandaracinaceae bacterium]
MPIIAVLAGIGLFGMVLVAYQLGKRERELQFLSSASSPKPSTGLVVEKETDGEERKKQGEASPSSDHSSLSEQAPLKEELPKGGPEVSGESPPSSNQKVASISQAEQVRQTQTESKDASKPRRMIQGGETTGESRTGTLVVAIPGGWAEVYREGQLLGRAPGRFTLPVGRNRLEIRFFGEKPGRVVVASVPSHGEGKLIVAPDEEN